MASFAANAEGTNYGPDVLVTTDTGNAPIVVTQNITNRQLRSFTANGRLAGPGSSPVVEWGFLWSYFPNPTMATGTKVVVPGTDSVFSANLTGLQFSTTYYVVSYAINQERTGFGAQIIANTLPGIGPTVTSGSAVDITLSSARLNGEVVSEGSSPVTERGIVWSFNSLPTVTTGFKTSAGSGPGNFSITATGLSTAATYHYRAFAINGERTSYDADKTFITNNLYMPGGGVTDYNGNVYQTILISGEEWMKENLKVLKLNNGAQIYGTGPGSLGQFRNPNDNSANVATCGLLYNGFAIDDPRGLCPVGWHVPSKAEWKGLVDYLGGENVAGGKLKAISALWNAPNIGASDLSGFSGQPAGYKAYGSLTYSYFGEQSHWWASDNDAGYIVAIFYNNATVEIDEFDTYSFNSVRCKKD